MSFRPPRTALDGRRLLRPETVYNITLDPINAPPIRCEAFTIRWTGGTAPFVMHLHDDDERRLRSLGPTTGDFYMWDPVDLPAGTRFFIRVLGSDGSESRISDAFVVQPGPVSMCLPGPSSTTTAPEPTAPVPSTTSSDVSGSSTSLVFLPAPATSLTTTTESLSPSVDTRTTDTPSSGILLADPSSHSLSSTSIDFTPFVLTTRTLYPLSSPIPTQRLSSGQVHPNAGYAVGIAMGLGCVAICGALAFWHVKRRRNCAVASSMNSFIDNRATNPRTDGTENEMVNEKTGSSDQDTVHSRGPRYETDGGVSLAGGRVGEVAMDSEDDVDSQESGCSTLPPSYSSDFGHS